MGTLRALPVGPGAFIGRDRELDHVGGCIAGTRVVTLIGAGGCGKTRLAAEVAAAAAPQFADGVYWVDLAGLGEAGLLGSTVASALGVSGRAEAPAETLVEQLAEGHLLVVLDNCEHLVAACASLVSELVSSCPRVHVLATSREPLTIESEAAIEVAPLAVPEADTRSARAVADAAAARLFEVRAQQVREDFRIDDDNAATVAEICRRLDGIPLAIELAAARIRVLAPAQIADGLFDRFGLLTGGMRDAPPRHRTLEASLEWSYALLDQAQRSALARLSVFVGSFELDAAEVVVAGDGISADDVLDLVAALVEQSWLQVSERGGRARYRLLESTRVYARLQLAKLEEVDHVHGRHLAFYVGLAKRAQAGLTGAKPGPWLARLGDDLDDLRSAMDWAVASGDTAAMLDIAEPILRFWFGRGLSTELYRRLHAAARTPGASDGDRARGLLTAALLALSDAEPSDAHDSATHAVDAAHAAAADDAAALGWSVRALSGAMTGLANREQVRADVEQAAERAERCGDAATHAYVLVLAGAALFRTDTIDAGWRLLEQARDVCHAREATFHLPAAHASLGLWPVLSGRLDETRQHARRGIELARQIGRPGWEAIGLTGLGAAAAFQGEHDEAQRLLSEAQALRPSELESTLFGIAVRHWLALSAYLSGDRHRARSTAETIVQIGRDRSSRWDEAVGEWLLGSLALDEDRPDEARAHLERCHAWSAHSGSPFPLGRASLGLAELAKLDEDRASAWELAHDGLEVLAGYGDLVGAAGALEAIADLAMTIGKPEQGLRLLGASDSFRTETGIQRRPQEVARFVHTLTAGRAALGDAGAEASWQEGGDLSLTDAIAYTRRGRGERGRPSSGWASLTPTELQLVQLVAQGSTNGQIGDRLFISVNTVKKHLSHVYTKLEVHGRADLAAEVARRGL
jgi:predicted ATPase/DNA-binding CsgD family transcriptional regulator